ncbi:MULTISPECIES: hypothetical protein [unclassified Aliivibrio]|uniref:hypothetical protein n=1 Tax=Vibrionaceae TaxID=641 RepID=UPI00080ED7CC|nr:MULTISPECIES: hypothetical protein [unclassified Aliivibrio]OCH17776.1 hypothetical protein A6E05_13570 [Aliivibrio sp. 1S165]OCH31886.1 hypothetical protein A6E06_19050 [Aliivibrio sp. 1S175]
MKYFFVKQMILGQTVALKIDEPKFEKLKLSREVLLSAKAIEEKYDLLVSNFLELEKEILSQLAQHMIFSQHSYQQSYELQSILNRRVVNLLTSTKLYYDQIEKHVRTCMKGQCKFGKEAKSYFSSEYDAHFEYRFMEALRNHVQHYGLAVHSLSLPSKWVGESEQKQLINQLKIYATKNEISQNKDFKKVVFHEMPEKVELIKAIRIYVGCFSHVHKQIRDLIQTNVSSSRTDIEAIINCYKEANAGDAIGIYAYIVEVDKPTAKPIEQFSLLLDWDNVRLNLREKNHSFPNISKWHVSGSCL